MVYRMFLRTLAFCAVASYSATAQNQTFINGLLDSLDGLGLTNFTNIIRQIESDSSQVAFFLTLSDASTSKTLFAPNNQAFNKPDINFYGYGYQPGSTNFLGALLLYHLVSGTWNQADLGTGPNHTIISTSLQGHSVSFLEGDTSQVIACGSSVAGFEIYNQLTTTAVVRTTTYEHVTIHTINAIIGMPGAYSFAASLVDMSQFLSVQQAATAPPIENARGVTIFAPVDSAFNASKSQLSSATPMALFSNHILMGQTIWYDTFESRTYTSQSGHNYSFARTPNLQYAVTLNGITANIIRSDFLIQNGVIHLIDNVLYNTAPEPTTSSSARSSTTVPTSSSSSSEPADTSGSTTSSDTGKSKSSLSGGAIAGIVIGAVGAISLVIIAFLLWRRQRQPEGYFDPPGPYTAAPSDTPSMGGKGGPTMLTSIAPAPLSYQSAPYDPSLISPQLIGPAPKAAYNPQVAPGPSSDALPPPTTSSSNLSEVPQQPPATVPVSPQPQVPISDEVVDHLLQRFVERIDRAPAGSGEAPPMYPLNA